jgi:hypothetical protein
MFTEKGQGIVEFAIVLAIVFVFIIVLLAFAGPAIGNMYSNIVPQG